MRKQEWLGYARSILRTVAGVLLPSVALKSCSSRVAEELRQYPSMLSQRARQCDEVSPLPPAIP